MSAGSPVMATLVGRSAAGLLQCHCSPLSRPATSAPHGEPRPGPEKASRAAGALACTGAAQSLVHPVGEIRDRCWRVSTQLRVTCVLTAQKWRVACNGLFSSWARWVSSGLRWVAVQAVQSTWCIISIRSGYSQLIVIISEGSPGLRHVSRSARAIYYRGGDCAHLRRRAWNTGARLQRRSGAPRKYRPHLRSAQETRFIITIIRKKHQNLITEKS